MRSFIARNTLRNSVIAVKLCETFVEMQWLGWPPKTRPSSYALPRRIRFGRIALKGVGINTGEREKLRSAGAPLSCDGRRGRPQDTRSSPTCVTLQTVSVGL